MKKRNAGFSLVEVIVVMAIMAVMAGMGVYGISVVPKYWARECAKKIASNLTEVKVITLGKAKQNGDIVWELYNDGGTYYVRYLTDVASGVTTNIHDETKVSKGSVHVYLADEGGNEVELGDGESLKLAFNRATGALYGCAISGMAIAGQKSPTGAPYSCNTSGYTPVNKIIARANTWEFVVDISPATGKISN